MNNTIKQLAEQAGMVMYPTGMGISENTIWGDRNIEAFANLIVRRCAEVALVEDTDPSDCILNFFGLK